MHAATMIKRSFAYFTQSHRINPEDFQVESHLFSAHASPYRLLVLRNLLTVLTEWTTEWCVNVFENRSLMRELEDAKFDLVIVDGMDYVRCTYMIPYGLGVPYVTLTPRHDGWSAGIPTSPAGEGMMGFTSLSKDPSFLERLASVVVYVAGNTLNPRYSVPDELIARYVPDREATTFDELFRRSELFLVNRDVICLDYPRLHTPHYQFIGGFGVRPSRPLPEDLERFVQGSGEAGVIVLTFGSAVRRLTPEIVAKLFAGLRSVKQRVVMRLAGQAIDVPANVWVSEWLPQNDLLGHAKTVLFITHGGVNGQLEALYHGVPLLTMPLFGDQKYNGKVAQDKGFGLTLDPYNFTAEDVTATINSMLGVDSKYRETIARCSAIVGSFPSAQERFVFWVDHILRFGGAHLRPTFVDLPMWKLFLLDIVAFGLVLLVSVVLMCRCCCRCVKRRCRRTQSKAKKE